MNYSDLQHALQTLSKALARKAIQDDTIKPHEIEPALTTLERNADSREHVIQFRNTLPNGTFEQLRTIYKDIDFSISMSAYKTN